MGVLEPPIIWILVAVVLVVLAVLVIVTASLRRARARRAAAWEPAAALGPGRSADVEPVTVPIDLSSARTSADGPAPSAAPPSDGTDRDDVPAHAGGPGAAPGEQDVAAEPQAVAPVDAGGDPALPADPAGPPTPAEARDRPEEEPLAAPLFRPWTMQNHLDARSTGTQPRHAMIDDIPAADGPATDHDAAGATPTDRDEPALNGTAPHEDSADDTLAMNETAAPVDASAPEATAAPGESAAKDRLLAVLLRDPQAAVRALAGRGDGQPTDTAGADLLRAGLSPSQVAQLVGVGEDELAAVVARGLGLLARGQDTTGRSRTDDPGRSWANAGSAAGATTPTTG